MRRESNPSARRDAHEVRTRRLCSPEEIARCRHLHMQRYISQAASMLLTFVSLAMLSSVSFGQEIRVSALQAWPHHYLLGTPHGIGFEAGIDLFGPVGLRFGYERYHDRFERIGSTCVGLLRPGDDCSDESLSAQSDIRAYVIAVPLSVFSSARLRLNAIPGYRSVMLESSQVGVASGRTLGSKKRMGGLQAGAEIVVAPVEGWPLRVALAGHVVNLNRYHSYIVVDGYNPFEADLFIAWLELGVSMALGW
jgi:hypothetical protein